MAGRLHCAESYELEHEVMQKFEPLFMYEILFKLFFDVLRKNNFLLFILPSTGGKWDDYETGHKDRNWNVFMMLRFETERGINEIILCSSA